MDDIIRFILGRFDVWTPIAAIIIGLLVASIRRKPAAETILGWVMLLVVGFIGVYGFIMHVFFAEFTAQQIGWQNNPFQYEVGIANLSYGVLGLLAFWSSKYHFRLATGIGFSVWFFGDGIGHIYQAVTAGNFAPYNVGTVLYTDLILPILTLVLLFLARPHGSVIKKGGQLFR